MNRHHDDSTHAPCTPTRTGTEPLAEPIDDSIWRGGESMVAPGCFFDLARVAENRDPQWRVI